MKALIRDWYASIQKKAQNFSQAVTSSLEMGKSTSHILVLDGVRAVACLAVLTFHINNLSDNNYNSDQNSQFRPALTKSRAAIY